MAKVRRILDGKKDAKRMDEKIKEYILSKKLVDLVIEQYLLLKRGDEKVRIDVRELQLPKLEFENEMKVGQGKGDMKEGDEVGYSKRQSKGSKAGDQKGEEFIEEYTVDEIIDMWTEKLGLPKIREYAAEKDKTEELEEIAKEGLKENINIKRTIIDNVKRNAKNGKAKIKGIDIKRDGVYDVWTEVEEEKQNAIEVYIRDISGSIGPEQDFLVRSTCFFMTNYLKKKYKSNIKKYATFQAYAEDATEKEFYSRNSYGGTNIYTGFDKAIEILKQYPDRDKFVFFFTDSEDYDMWHSNSAWPHSSKKSLDELLKVADRVYYSHLNHPEITPNFFHEVKQVEKKNKKLVTSCLYDLDSLRETIKKFLGLDENEKREE